jgi:hypothetical protein
MLSGRQCESLLSLNLGFFSVALATKRLALRQFDLAAFFSPHPYNIGYLIRRIHMIQLEIFP